MSDFERAIQINKISSAHDALYDGRYYWDTTDLDMVATSSFVFDKALGMPWDIFSTVEEEGIETLYEIYPYKSDKAVTIHFMLHPCMEQEQNGPGSCNEVCGDPQKLFGAWETLWSCLSLASFSIARETMSNGNNSDIIRGAIDTAMDGLSIDNINDFDGKSVLNKTLTCATASCAPYAAGDKPGHCDPGFEERAQNFFDEKVQDWSFLNKTFCLEVGNAPSTDVGGPGVTLGYQIQMWIALVTWIATRTFTSATTLNNIHRVLSRVRHPRRGPVGDNLITIYPRFGPQLERLAESNLSHATSSLLADFQDAQCFFVAAVSIAVIYTTQTRSAQFTGAGDWGSMIQSQRFASQLGKAGLISIVLTLWSLQRRSMDSVYILLCSTIAGALAAVSSLQMEVIDAHYVRELLRNDGDAIDECGGNPALTSFCAILNARRYAEGPDYETICALAALALICCDKIGLFLLKRQCLHRNFRGAGAFDNVIFRFSPATLKSTRLVVSTIFTLFQAFIAVLVIMRIMEMHNVEYRTNGAAWNLGQVIAMLIWVPVLAKYIYTVLFGVENGFAIRLSQAFTVLRNPRNAALSGSQEEKDGLRDGPDDFVDVEFQGVLVRWKTA